MSGDVMNNGGDKIGEVTRAIRAYKEYAQTKRQSGDIETAATYYIAGARGYLMQFRRLPDNQAKQDTGPPTPDSIKFGFAMKYLLVGALCYRLASSSSRCRRHCEQGEAIVSDLLDERTYTTDARIGLFHEIRGDLRLIGDLGSHDEEYALAADRYENVENDLGWSMEGGFEDVIQIPLELAESVDLGPDPERRNEIMYTSLDKRIEYKRKNYPAIIDAVVEAGNWESELL